MSGELEKNLKLLIKKFWKERVPKLKIRELIDVK